MDIFLNPLLYIISLAIGLIRWSVIISVILSWLVNFNVVNPHNQFINNVGEILFRITEPFLRPIRRLLPSSQGIDFAPLVLIFVLIFLEMVIGQIGAKFFGARF